MDRPDGAAALTPGIMTNCDNIDINYQDEIMPIARLHLHTSLTARKQESLDVRLHYFPQYRRKIYFPDNQ